MPVRTKSVRLIGALVVAVACWLAAPLGASADPTLFLRFVNQPAASLKGDPIKGTPGASPSVEIVDSNGNRRESYRGSVTMLLDETPGFQGDLVQSTETVRFVSGVATFSNLRVTPSGTYRLTATSPDVISVTSGEFEVADVIEPCNTASCKTQKAVQGRSSTFSIDGALTAGSGLLLVSNGIGPGLTCEDLLTDYFNPSLDTYQFAVQPALGSTGSVFGDKRLTLIFSKATMKAVTNNGGPFLEACFGAPYDFPVKPGTGLLVGGVRTGEAAPYNYDPSNADLEGFRGLLPNCGTFPADQEIACVVSREKTGGGIGIVRVLVKGSPLRPDDPRMH